MEEKNIHLEMRNLTKTELQRLEERKAEDKTRIYENRKPQRPATLKRLKRGDDNELERNLKLENVPVVDSEQLRLAVETEEERRARLENVAATKLLSLAMEMDKERKPRLQKMVATTQLMLALTKGVVNVGVVLSLNPF